MCEVVLVCCGGGVCAGAGDLCLFLLRQLCDLRVEWDLSRFVVFLNVAAQLLITVSGMLRTDRLLSFHSSRRVCLKRCASPPLSVAARVLSIRIFLWMSSAVSVRASCGCGCGVVGAAALAYEVGVVFVSVSGACVC